MQILCERERAQDGQQYGRDDSEPDYRTPEDRHASGYQEQDYLYRFRILYGALADEHFRSSLLPKGRCTRLAFSEFTVKCREAIGPGLNPV